MASTEDDVVVRLRLKDVARFIADVKSGKLAIDDLEKKISKAGRTAARESEPSGGGFGKLGKVLGGLKWYAIGAVGSLASAAAGVAGFAVKSASNLQQVTIAYTTLMGSASAAHRTLKSLRKFAIDTPFQLPTLEEAGKLLLAYKFSAQSLIPTLTAVGDAASALSLGDEGVTGIVNVLGQIKGASVLHGQDLLQLTSRGIMAKDWLEQAFHLTPQQLDKAISKGKISAAAAVPVILAGMEKQFKGQMATQANALGGVASNFVDATRDALMNAVNPYLPAMTTWLQRAIDLVGSAGFQKALARTISQVITGAQGAVNLGKQVFAWGKGYAGQAKDWVSNLVTLIQGAVASGDWTPVGGAIGTAIRNALTSLGGQVGGAAGNVDWYDMGKKSFSGAVTFALGFVSALLDPGVWWGIIKSHWLDVAMIVLTVLTDGFGGLIGKFGVVLAKLPLIGFIGRWITGLARGITTVRGPIMRFASHIASSIGRAFMEVWPELGARLWYLGARIGEFFSKDIPGLRGRLKDWIFKGAKGLPEWLATKFFQAFDWLLKRFSAVAGKIWQPLKDAFSAVMKWIDDWRVHLVGWLAGLPIIGAIFGGKSLSDQSGYPSIGPQPMPGTVPGHGMGPVPGHATGGIMTQTHTAWVGESGPELVTLPKGRAVIPLPRVPEFTGGRGPIHVHVMVDKREIAQAVYDDMGDRVARR